MLFVIHGDGISTRAKFYRAHRIHLDQAEQYNVDVPALLVVGVDLHGFPNRVRVVGVAACECINSVNPNPVAPRLMRS